MGEQPAKTPQTAVKIFSQIIEGQTRQQDQRSVNESAQPNLKELKENRKLELEWIREVQQEGVIDSEQEGRSKTITEQNVQIVNQLADSIGRTNSIVIEGGTSTATNIVVETAGLKTIEVQREFNPNNKSLIATPRIDRRETQTILPGPFKDSSKFDIYNPNELRLDNPNI